MGVYPLLPGPIFVLRMIIKVAYASGWIYSFLRLKELLAIPLLDDFIAALEQLTHPEMAFRVSSFGLFLET